MIKNIAFLCGKEVYDAIRNIKKDNQVIVVTNPHKVSKLSVDIQWDLVVIDEAHDIICNSQAQTYNFYDYDKYNRETQKYELSNKIDEAYKIFCDSFDSDCSAIEENIKNQFEIRKEYIDVIKNKALAQFAKSVTVEEYCRYMNLEQISIVSERRDNQNVLFDNICALNAVKTMFLTATPYKYNKDYDFINYALAGTKMTTKNQIILARNFPDLDWVGDLYTTTSVDKMLEANTSLMFKEIAQAIPLTIPRDTGEFQDKKFKVLGKDRNIEVWDENSGKKGNENSVLRNKLLGEDGILNKDDQKKNRVIIFVSNSNEGKIVFDRIFPEAEDDITIHREYTNNNGITCEFIMNKFGNAKKLKDYAKESVDSKIPDILIVTWQVAQVGVNLPTFNYVVNYHIPPVPGYLEQRYGRIDRLNSENNPLYNIYYLDNIPSTQVYRVNLVRALCDYKNSVMDIPHNLPVKNLLICNGLSVKEIDSKELYISLAYYIYSYKIIVNKRIDDKIKEWNSKLNGGKGLEKVSTENDSSTVREIKVDDERVSIINENKMSYFYPQSEGLSECQNDDETNENANANDSGEDKTSKTDNIEKQIMFLIEYITKLDSELCKKVTLNPLCCINIMFL